MVISKSGIVDYSAILIMAIIISMITIIEYNISDNIFLLIFVIEVFLLIGFPAYGVFALLANALLFDDLPLEIPTPGFGSLYTKVFLGQSLTTWLTIVAFLRIGYSLLHGKAFQLEPHLKRVFIVLIISGLFGLVSLSIDNLRWYVNDIRFLLNVLIGYLGVLIYIKSDYLLRKFFRYLCFLFIAKMMVLLFHTGLLLNDHVIYNIIPSTTFVLAPMLLLISFYLFGKRKALLVIVGLLFIAVSAVTASRGRIALFLLQSVLVLILLGRKKKLIPLFIFLLPVPLIVSYINEDVYNFLIWKLSSFSPSLESSMSSYVRLIEYKNIFYQNLTNPIHFVFGSGFGGYWNSSRFPYEVNLVGTDSYPVEWIVNDRFYRPHGIIQWLFLKTGIVGALSVYISSVIFVRQSYLSGRRRFRETESFKMICILSTAVVSLLLINYSAIHALYLGFLVGSVVIVKKQGLLEK
jgi:hypothetical protein